MDQHWIFELVEREPELLLAMSEQEFRAEMLEAGFDVDELSQLFEQTIKTLIAELRSGHSS